ncbi:efflux RND transporter periplasmic adaptor subunit [Paenibacillus allorhizosphaerae]|uniref:Efflux system component YknX n=1 Tax=Paenibacillus allorhizosphaerae TaxID=2849866 RepID=A0ABM8VMX8_9BACL|nr:efflux RND transporter periplasmic adaptor subunit [Paenibacillus allorhizosphaerae]CAG7650686.1 Putative efflux system component YknX [Paenibacillus allorhizosphaerae]
MNKKKWMTAGAAILVLGITGLLYWQSQPSKQAAQSMQKPANALQFKVAREDLTSTVEVKGKSSYQKQTYINAPFSADIKSWFVTDGAQVLKGDKLFQLDDASLRNEIAKLQADAKKMEMDIRLGQFQETIDSDSSADTGISETDAKQRFAKSESRKMQEDISRLNLEHSRVQLTEMTEKLQSAQFSAPEDGIFLFESTKEPQSLKENERVGKIVDLKKLQLLAIVGEYDLFRIKEGMDAEVKVDALKGVKLQGKVERLSKFAKNDSDADEAAVTTAAQFEVVISLEPDERLIAGLSLTASIETDKKAGALVIPTLVVQREKEESFVMVMNASGALERRVVQVGVETPEKTEIVSGLQEGETVVLQ